MQLPVLPADKANHVVYGAAIVSACETVLPNVVLPVVGTHVFWHSLVVCAAFAVGKELVDLALNTLAKKKGLAPSHGVEPLDAVATVAGGALIVLPKIVALAAA